MKVLSIKQPENADLPYSAIIGWADVVRCDEPGKNTSEIWAQNEFTGWVLENVQILMSYHFGYYPGIKK